MAKGISTVWVPVTQLDRAVEFYRTALGFEVEEMDPAWAEADANGVAIGLNARENVGGSSTGGAVITFQPEGTIEDELERVRERGGSIEGEISEHPWGRILPFKDSEGNDLQFYTPPQD